MRLAIISDIHGNDVALGAALDDLDRHPVDEIVCLGDAIQGGPQPVEVCARLRDLEIPTVMGNADAWLLSGRWTAGQNLGEERLSTLEKVRAWSLGRLGAADRTLIDAFRPTIEVAIEGGASLLCFHGSPTSFDDVILPATPAVEIERLLGPWKQHHLAGGHTHVQHVHHLDRNFYFNPGSVGMAYRHGQGEGDFRLDPWAEYAVLASEGGRLTLEFRRVPFDVDALVAAYEASGRPHAAESVAQYGRQPAPGRGDHARDRA